MWNERRPKVAAGKIEILVSNSNVENDVNPKFQMYEHMLERVPTVFH